MQRRLGYFTMYALLAAVLAGVLALALSGAAMAAKAPETNSARGKGEVVAFSEGHTCVQKFSFKAANVEATPATDDAKGKLSSQTKCRDSSTNKPTSTNKLKGTVRCMSVFENQAVLVFEATNSPFEGRFFRTDVTDSGQPNGEGDRYRTTSASAEEAENCPVPTGGTRELTKGNIVVTNVGVVV